MVQLFDSTSFSTLRFCGKNEPLLLLPIHLLPMLLQSSLPVYELLLWPLVYYFSFSPSSLSLSITRWQAQWVAVPVSINCSTICLCPTEKVTPSFRRAFLDHYHHHRCSFPGLFATVSSWQLLILIKCLSHANSHVTFC